MKLLVNAIGAWVAVQAAEGRYPRPVAIGLTMLVARLGTPAAALAVAGYALKRLDEAGAFDEWRASRRRPAERTRLPRSAAPKTEDDADAPASPRGASA